MCSRTWIRSLGCRARSPESVGEYAYNADAMESTGGDDAYAGGGAWAGAGYGSGVGFFSFKLAAANWLVGGGKP